MEIATHPDDLCIVCRPLKEKPHKWYLGIFRGRGHHYKPLLTSDKPESWGNSKEENLKVIRRILTAEALRAVYFCCAPETFEEFLEEARNWGFTEEWFEDGEEELLRKVFARYSEGDTPSLFSSLSLSVDKDRCLNAHMIAEIMGRLEEKDVVDTSSEPLKSFTGNPTSPTHRLGFYENLGSR